MKKTFFTPGPTQLFPTVANHLQTALRKNVLEISHRSKVFEQIYQNAVQRLKDFYYIPDDYQIFFLASGTEAMERIIENSVDKTSFHFINGAFSKRFAETTKELGKKVFANEMPAGQDFDYEVSIPIEAELICFTQNETSIGYQIEPKNILKIAKKYPDKLIAVDVVSSAPYPNLNFSKLDYVFFSVQKCFGLPAGLGVLIISPRAIIKAKQLNKKNINIGSYHNLLSLLKYGAKNQTPDTPNVLNIYLLGQVLKDFQLIGLDAIRKQLETKAAIVNKLVEQNDFYKFFVKNPNARSKTVFVLEIVGNSKVIINHLADKGFIIGSGYKEFKQTQIRIANFPATTIKQMTQLVKELDIY